MDTHQTTPGPKKEEGEEKKQDRNVVEMIRRYDRGGGETFSEWVREKEKKITARIEVVRTVIPVLFTKAIMRIS